MFKSQSEYDNYCSIYTTLSRFVDSNSPKYILR